MLRGIKNNRFYLPCRVTEKSCVNFPSSRFLLQETMHTQGCVSPGAEEEGGREPQDLLPHEGHSLPAS
jgi:hypothetical protein